MGRSRCSNIWNLETCFESDQGTHTTHADQLRQHNFDIHPSLPCGNLTIETCVNACGTAGFLLAGIEFADKCYCRDKLENNSKGNPEEFCGGPYLLSLAFLMNDSDS
ncbi:hypothetical protein K439DRAFT_1535300 [Ramaria rubella]|nr:hypothetical protein K439DRAFT_1535300 [Ramaria rubella]